jgi:hypothetical protein
MEMESGLISDKSVGKFLDSTRDLPHRLRANILFELLIAFLGGIALYGKEPNAFYVTMIVMLVSWMPVILSRSESRDAALEAAQNTATALVRPTE